jgi:hypothetical protein
MKRSDVVAKLKEAIIEGFIKPDELLYVVEEAGMVPKSTKTEDRWFWYQHLNNYQGGEIMEPVTTTIYEWEGEDEPVN